MNDRKIKWSEVLHINENRKTITAACQAQIHFLFFFVSLSLSSFLYPSFSFTYFILFFFVHFDRMCGNYPLCMYLNRIVVLVCFNPFMVKVTSFRCYFFFSSMFYFDDVMVFQHFFLWVIVVFFLSLFRLFIHLKCMVSLMCAL